MSDDPVWFTELLDEYLAAKADYEYLDHPNSAREPDVYREQVHKRFLRARDKLNKAVKT